MLGAIEYSDRQVLTIVAAHRTMRETLRVSHHREAGIESLIDEVSARTDWKPVSDIALPKLCPDSRRAYFTPEHDPGMTAQQAVQDVRSLTNIIREALA